MNRKNMMMIVGTFALGFLGLGAGSVEAQTTSAAAAAPVGTYSQRPALFGPAFSPAFVPNAPTYVSRPFYSASPTGPVRTHRQYDPTGRNSTLAKPWLRPLQ